MPFKRMGHVAIEVNDVEKAIKWYCEKLGMRPRWTADSDWGNLGLGKDDLSLVSKNHHKHPPHFGFRVESREELQKMHAQLKDQGVDVEKISGHRDGSMTFYFKDLDGNILEAVWDPKIEEEK